MKVSYLVAVAGFYIAYLISTVLYGRIGLLIKRALTSPSAELEGFLLLFVAELSTLTSLLCVLFIFTWFDQEPNWYILTPIMIAVWFYFTPALYRPHFSSGAAHWGMLLGVIKWVLIMVIT